MFPPCSLPSRIPLSPRLSSRACSLVKMMAVGSLDEEILSPEFVDHTRRMCGPYFNFISSPHKNSTGNKALFFRRAWMPGHGSPQQQVVDQLIGRWLTFNFREKYCLLLMTINEHDDGYCICIEAFSR